MALENVTSTVVVVETPTAPFQGFRLVITGGAAASGPASGKSMPVTASPLACIESVICATTPAPRVAVAGSLSQVGTELELTAAQGVAKTCAVKMSAPSGSPRRSSTELWPG